MSVFVTDLGELVESGVRAFASNEGGSVTVYVHEGLSEAERAVAVARLDAACVKEAREDRFLHPVPASTTAIDADRFVAHLVAEFEKIDPAGAAALATIDEVISRETGTAYLRVLVAERARRMTAAVLANLTDAKMTETTAFALLALEAKQAGDEAASAKRLERAAD